MAGKPEKKEQQYIFFSILDLNGTAKTFELRLKREVNASNSGIYY